MASRLHAGPQPGNGGGDGRGVVREVIDDGDTADGPAHFQPPPHPLEGRQRLDGLGRRDADVLGRHDGGNGIGPVVLAGQRQAHAPLLDIAAPEREHGGIGFLGHVTGVPAVGAQSLGLAPAATGQHPLQRLGVRRPDDPPLPGHGTHQMMELGLDGPQIREDVRVVVLQVVEHGGTRPVVHELGTLVEEGRVVFVSLDDEIGLAPQARRDREVARHATDQEARLAPGSLKDPGQQRSRGGLAVRAGHAHHPAPDQHLLGQPLRPRDVGQPGVQNGFHQRIAPPHHVAHHPDIGLERQLGRVPALDQVDAQRAQLVAHRRVDVGVAAGDLEARLAGNGGHPTHEGAANTKNMYVHPTILAAATSAMARRPAWRSPLCPCGDIVRDQATGSTVTPPGRARRLAGRHPGKLVAARARCVQQEPGQQPLSNGLHAVP